MGISTLKGEGVHPGASSKELKNLAKYLDKDSRKYSLKFEPLPIPDTGWVGASRLVEVFRNRNFLVQVYDQSGWVRLSISRAALDPKKNRWVDGISWDSLQLIKGSLGYGDRDAVEIYPKDDDVVDVANIRHLFILPYGHKLDCIWR